MKYAIVASVCLSLAACAPIQKKSEPPSEPPKQVQLKKIKRFDGLVMLRSQAAPERDDIRDRFRFERALNVTSIDGLRYFFYQPQKQRSVVGFTVLNDGSPKINPVGLKRKGARREYTFMFADRARENIHLKINDDVRLSRRFSHDNMFRELHFFPRRQLPAVEVDQSKGVVRVTLPTGEPVLFDQQSMEVVGGVLSEAPIDFNRNRHERHNPRVKYRGDYLAVTVAQRGEAPRRAQVWGQKKYAEVHYPAKYKKACKISPKHIWDQRPMPGDSDPRLTMLHPTDHALFNVIERQCKWNLSALRQTSPLLVEAAE